MAYLSRAELEAMKFASLGQNVKISDKASIYDPEQMHLGDNCRIDDFCVVSGKISLGRNIHVTPMCLIAGGRPGITIKDFSTLAYRVSVFAQTDDYSGRTMVNSTVPKRFKAETFAAVIIDRHCVVGTGAVIAPGVHLAIGTAVGAQSFVNASTESWGVYAGAPARRIKERAQALLHLEQQLLQEETKQQDD